MQTVVIKHIKVSELPANWLGQLQANPDETVTVTIEKEAVAEAVEPNHTFGMWADRKDIGDAGEYVRQLRQPRYTLK